MAEVCAFVMGPARLRHSAECQNCRVPLTLVIWRIRFPTTSPPPVITATAGVEPGAETLVLDVAGQLVACKGVTFADRGETDMPDFDEPVRLFEVQWQ
jgi:hypothetical protein